MTAKRVPTGLGVKSRIYQFRGDELDISDLKSLDLKFYRSDVVY